MGINNRERRRVKKQQRRRHGGRVDAGQVGGRQWPDEQLVRSAVLAAAEAYRFEPKEVYELHLDGLGALEATAGRASLERALTWWVDRGLDRAWESGWQPGDVMRAVRRTLSRAHAGAFAGAVAESGGRRPEAGADDRWAGQVAGIRGDHPDLPDSRLWPDLALAVEGVSLLLHLPPLPRLSTPSTRSRTSARGGSGAMLERVRALLAKAESTTFPEEAEALTAKAQELMARHAIDQAMLEAGNSTGSTDVGGWRISVDDPYAAAKSVLLNHIACANRCRAVWAKHLGFSTVFGTRSDLEMVELLFTSLLVQGTEAMVRAGRSVDSWGRSRTRSFRQSFLLAYALRIGERLTATTEKVVAEGTGRHGQSLLPVLARRAEKVEEAVQAAYPHTVERGMAISNYSGWVAGRAAADLASLTVAGELAPR